MSKLEIISDNVYRKVTTGADYNRPTGVLKDEEVTITASQAASRIVPVGFMYEPGINALEVYVNGVYKRANNSSEGFTGDYEEYSRSSVQFEAGVISQDDRVRFRVTSAYYRNRGGLGTSGSSGSSGYGFTWQGPWETDYYYSEFDVVENDGSAWVAIVDHTSGANTEPGVGADSTAYWDYFLSNPTFGTSGSSGSSGSSGAAIVNKVDGTIQVADWVDSTSSYGSYYAVIDISTIGKKRVIASFYESDVQIIPTEVVLKGTDAMRVYMDDNSVELTYVVLG